MIGPHVSRLGAEGVTVGYGGDPVVHDLTLDIPDGRVTTIVGPNGCGKSTLLRTLARLLKPTSGRVRLDGDPIDAVPTREVSRRLALLPQSPTAPDGLLVRDLVGRGRHPHQRWFRQWSPDDEDVVEGALRMTDTWDLRDRALDELSGGQRQRAWIAMTLAQDTDLVLLDEPTTFLDLAHQIEVLDLACRLNRERGRTVTMVLHDLNLAARYSDLVVVMKDGVVVTQGGPREVFTVPLLEEVFGLQADVLDDPRTGLPVVVPVSAGLHPAAALGWLPTGTVAVMTSDAFVPADFVPPTSLVTDQFHLEPLGPQHNEADHAAWMSSIAHIRSTLGFVDGSWPPPEGMTLEANLSDLRGHAEDFERRSGFTFTVLDPDDHDVIGCVYVYPSRSDEWDVQVNSWVRADRADLDVPLADAVAGWLAADWPWLRVDRRGR